MPQDPKTIPNFYGKIVPTGIKHREQGIQTDVLLGADGKYIIDITEDMQNHAPEDTPFLTLLEGLGTETIDKPIVNWMDEYESVQWADIGLDDFRLRKVATGSDTIAVGSTYGIAKPAGLLNSGTVTPMAHTIPEAAVPKALSDGSQIGGQLKIHSSKIFTGLDTAADMEFVMTTSNTFETSSPNASDLLGAPDSFNMLPIDNAGNTVMCFRQTTGLQGNGSTMIEKLRNRAFVFGYTRTYAEGPPIIEVFEAPAGAEYFMYLAIENADIRLSQLDPDNSYKAVDNNYDLSTVVQVTQVIAKIKKIFFDHTTGHVALLIGLNREDSNIDLEALGVYHDGTNYQCLIRDTDAKGFGLHDQTGNVAHGRLIYHASHQTNQKVGVAAVIHPSHGYNYIAYGGTTGQAPSGTSDSGSFTNYSGSISRCVLVRHSYAVPKGVPEFDRLDTAQNLIFHREAMHNLAQIFTQGKYGLSGTAQATKYRFEGDFEKTRAFHLEAFKKRQENAFLFGVEYQAIATSNDSAVNGGPVRALSGLFDYSKFPIRYLSMPFPNLTNMASTDSIAGMALFTFMRNLADHLTSFRSRNASKTLTFMAGEEVIRQLSMFNAYYTSAWNPNGNLMGGNVQIQQPSSMTFGLEVFSYKVGSTTLQFIHNPAFDLEPYMPIPAWIYGDAKLNPRSMLLLIDSPNMRKAVLRPDRILGNVQEQDRDGYLEGMRGECSLKLRYPKNFAVVKLT